MVEQRTENPRVTGSIPVGTTLSRDAKCCVSFFVSFLKHSIEAQDVASLQQETKKAPPFREVLLCNLPKLSMVIFQVLSDITNNRIGFDLLVGITINDFVFVIVHVSNNHPVAMAQSQRTKDEEESARIVGIL